MRYVQKDNWHIPVQYNTHTKHSQYVWVDARTVTYFWNLLDHESAVLQLILAPFGFSRISHPLCMFLSFPLLSYHIILQWTGVVKSPCICGRRSRRHYHRWWSYRMDPKPTSEFSILCSCWLIKFMEILKSLLIFFRKYLELLNLKSWLI